MSRTVNFLCNKVKGCALNFLMNTPDFCSPELYLLLFPHCIRHNAALLLFLACVTLLYNLIAVHFIFHQYWCHCAHATAMKSNNECIVIYSCRNVSLLQLLSLSLSFVIHCVECCGPFSSDNTRCLSLLFVSLLSETEALCSRWILFEH